VRLVVMAGLTAANQLLRKTLLRIDGYAGPVYADLAPQSHRAGSSDTPAPDSGCRIGTGLSWLFVDLLKIGDCRDRNCHGSRLAMRDTVLCWPMNGLIWGLIIALIALGLSVIFGLLDIINIGSWRLLHVALCWRG